MDERTAKFQELGAKMSLALTLQEWEDYLKLLSEELHPGKLRQCLKLSRVVGKHFFNDSYSKIW